MTKDRRTFLKQMSLGVGGIWAADRLMKSSDGAAQEPSAQTDPYKLPELPYAYNALVPVIDEETLKLHHGKHHAGYVRGLNQAEQKLADARKNKQFELIKYLEREIAFHGSGHILHSIYWQNLTPEGGNEPDANLQSELKKSFGHFDSFHAQMVAATNSVEGSGWGILAYQPIFKKLVILQAEKHQDLTQWGAIPLLAIDVWEHAYYLKYQNRRKEYITKIFDIINWKWISERFEEIQNGS